MYCFYVHGSVHFKNIPIYIQQDATLHSFALFRFQFDTLIIIYTYNLGFLSISTCFGPIGPSSGDQML
jgi:hypothetical protein